MTDRQPSAINRESAGPRSPRRVHCIALAKELPDGSVDNYFFIFTNETASDMLKVIQRFAADDDLSFDWGNAGTVTMQVYNALKSNGVKA